MSTIEFSADELQLIAQATQADIEDAVQWSSVRCPETSPLDHRALKAAPEDPKRLVEHLKLHVHLICTLARAVEHFCKGFELAARLRLWLKQLELADKRDRDLELSLSQRGALA